MIIEGAACPATVNPNIDPLAVIEIVSVDCGKVGKQSTGKK